MSYIRFIPFVVLFQIISWNAFAESASQDSIDKLLVLSGLQSQINDTAALTSMSLGQTPLVASDSKKLQKFSAAIADANALIDGASQSLKASLSESQAQKVIAWYESNFGNKIARAEEAGSTPEAMQAAMANAQSLLSDAERVAQIDKLIARMDAITESIDMQKTLTSAIFAGMSSLQAPDMPVDLATIQTMVDSQLAGVKSQIEQQTRVMMLNMYSDFTVAELEEYYKVLGRPEMKAFNDAGMQGVVAVISNAIRTLIASDA